MFGFRLRKRDPDKHRYYLLPGMGRANRRKHSMNFKISVIVGIVVGAMVGLLIYFTNR